MRHHKRVANLFTVLVLVAAQVHISTEDEITDNTLPVVFSTVTEASWQSKCKSKFRTQVPSLINSYCPKNIKDCGLKFWNKTRQFKSSHVEFVAYLAKDSNLEVKFYVSLPNGSDIREERRTVMPGPTLEKILWQKKKELSTAIGITILSVGTNGVATDSDNSTKVMNFIMIPISFVVLIVVCLLAYCLHTCHKMKIKSLEAERRKQLAMKRQSQKLDFTGSTSKQDAVPGYPRKDKQIFSDNNNKNDCPEKDHPYLNNLQEDGMDSSQSHQRKRHRKKNKASKEHEENKDEGNGTLEFEEQNQLAFDGTTLNAEINVENKEPQVLKREPQKRKTKRKKRKQEHNLSYYVDEGFDEANGSYTLHANGQKLQEPQIPRQLPPVRTSRNRQYNISDEMTRDSNVFRA